MLYLSLSGPSLFFKKQSEPEQWRINRARISAQWHRKSVRSVLWSHPETRRQLLVSLFRPPEPMSFEEADKTMLNHMRLPIRLDLTQEDFLNAIHRLYPSDTGSPYLISEWDMACPKCGKEVTGYPSDSLWNERYLTHRRDACGKTSEANLS